MKKPLYEVDAKVMLNYLKAWEQESCQALQLFSKNVLLKVAPDAESWSDFKGDAKLIPAALLTIPTQFRSILHAREVQLAMEAAENDEICAAYGVKTDERIVFAAWLMDAIPQHQGMPPLDAWVKVPR